MVGLNKFLIYQWNARGIRSNGHELIQYIHNTKRKPHVICIQETFLPPGETFNIPNYVGLFKPRITGSYGGCAIYVSTSISYKEVDTPPNKEFQKIIIKGHNTDFVIINFYNPCTDVSHDFLSSIINDCGHSFILCGDFNSHNPIWGSKKIDKNGREVELLLTNYDLVLLNDGTPTRQDPGSLITSSIDLSIVTRNLSSRCNWSAHNLNFNSDHFLITIDIVFQRDAIQIPTDRNLPQNWSYHKANWDQYKDILSKEVFDNFDNDVQKMYDNFIGKIKAAADQSIPKTNPNKHPPPMPWWNEKCKLSIKARNKAKNKAMKSMLNEDLIDYQNKKREAQKVIRQSKKSYWENYCNSLNRFTPSTEVWRKVKIINGVLSNTKQNKHIPLLYEDTFINDNVQKANLLADFFGKCMNYDNDNEVDESKYPPKLPIRHNIDSEYLNELITMNELKWAIAQSNDNSPGEDRIGKQLISNLPDNAMVFLLYMLNVIFDTSDLPSSWSHAIVVPIQKQGKKEGDIDSYRPISLTPYLCKINERILSFRLNWYLEKHNLISPLQTGFRKNSNVLDNPMRLERDVYNTFAENKYLACVFLDYQQAYDRVWRQALPVKMKYLGIQGKILHWITNLTKNRTFQVRVNGCLSEVHTTQRGLPQGSVLSPTLFNIYINDITQVVNNSSMALFADDIAIWNRNQNIEILGQELQGDLNKIESWSNLWKLKLSVPKTKAMVFTKKTEVTEVHLKLYDLKLECVKTFKFLGLTFDSRLNWGAHVDKIAQRCKKKINILKMITGTTWGPDTKTLLLFYRALIRSLIDYGSELYGATSGTNIGKINAIQYNCLKLITGALPQTSREALQVECGEMPPVNRQIMRSEFYKIRLLGLDECQPVTKILEPCWQDSVLKLMFNRLDDHRRPFATRTRECVGTVEKYTVPPKPPWKLNIPVVHFDIHNECKVIDDPNHKRNIALDYINICWKNQLHIYTDGSKDPTTGRTSASFCIPKLKVSKSRRISPISVCRAEQVAILLALSWLEEFPPAEITILTDSLSSLWLISNIFKLKSNLILEIHNLYSLLINRGFRISFAWIPAHCGIQGNEIADGLAKKALICPQIQMKLDRNQKEFRNRSKNKLTDLWQFHWSHSLSGRPLHYIQPYVRNIDPIEGLSRREEVIIHRLRCGKAKLGEYLYTLKKRPHNKCLTCNNVDSVGHYLIFCKRFDKERQKLKQNLKVEELSIKIILKPTNTHNLITFVKDTGMYYAL